MIRIADKYCEDVDNITGLFYTSKSSPPITIMPAIYHHAQKSKYRITLEIEALGDFDPHNINWDKLFQLEGSEHCDAYVEDLSTPDRW